MGSTRKPKQKPETKLDLQRKAALELSWDLAELLKNESELQAKLKEALETDRFVITVTFQKKYKPDDEHDLHHYYIRKNFMVNDVVPSLKHLAADFTAKENPTAELADKKNWH